MNKTVLCFGEALIDFLNIGTQQDDVLSLNQFTQYPGGAPANAAVAIAKLGGKATFAGQVGADPFGDFLKSALTSYNVDTQFIHTHPSAKTALAFVFLDKEGERSFSFHRENTADMIFNQSQVSEVWFDEQPIFHFCSNTLTESPIAQVTKNIVEQAKKQHCLISFDVNLRHDLWSEKHANRALVNKFVMQSDLVKFAKEEIDYLCNGQLEHYLAECFANGVKNIVITDGANPIRVCNEFKQLKIVPPCIKAVDTTGGGDAFIGAILYGLCQGDEDLLYNSERFSSLVKFASQCGALAVSRPGAFPAFPTFDEVKEWYIELS
jgi:fructokinase